MGAIDFLTAETDLVTAALLDLPASPRKCRLFAVACCRHAAEFIHHPPCRRLVDLAEGFADGSVLVTHVRRARRAVHQWSRRQGDIVVTPEEWDLGFYPGPVPLGSGRWEAIWAAYQAAVPAIVPPCNGFLNVTEYRPYLADIFGNPFRPAQFSPDWRSDTVVALARTMYDGRDFGIMPVLADALDDAGCDHPGILAHCRGPGPHVRGCWVVDLVLNKS